MSDLVTSEAVTEETQSDAQKNGEDTKLEENLPKGESETDPIISETPQEPSSIPDTEAVEEENKPENVVEQTPSSEETGINLMSQESDVLELDYGVDGVEDDQLGKEEIEKVDKPDDNVSDKVSDDLKDCRLLWISGVDQNVKANDFRIAFEPFGKVESGKLVMISVKGVKECKGIVTMKTVKGADDVIKHMNGSKIGDHIIQIEKRARDPTKPKEPKANKEV